MVKYRPSENFLFPKMEFREMSKMASFGAFPQKDGTVFRVRATEAHEVSVVLFENPSRVKAQFVLGNPEKGIFEGLIPEIGHGSLYKFKLDDLVLPDPFARYLPYGVHGPAMVYSDQFPWKNLSPRPDRKNLIAYELHVGAFTPGGNFKEAGKRLSYLKDLGVNLVEIMPISSFPGKRGWGYDGVNHFAPFSGYGTPGDVKAFIDSAHGLGLSVILDLVLNHFGPDGNYLYAFCRDFFDTPRKTPWGDALNYQNPYLRQYFFDCVKQWLRSPRDLGG